MATGQRILDRIKQAAEGPRGVLPLSAFYGREPEQEAARNRMHDAVRRVMAMADDMDLLPARREYLLLDIGDAVQAVDVNASPVEFLVWRGEMATEQDEEGMAGVRFRTAIRIRDLTDGSMMSRVKSPSFLGAGGGGGRAMDITSYQVDCAKLLGRISEAMPEPWLFPMLELVVLNDGWLDLRGGAPARRHRTLEALRYGLDVAAATLRYIAWGSLRTRWGDTVPPKPRGLPGPESITRAPVLPR